MHRLVSLEAGTGREFGEQNISGEKARLNGEKLHSHGSPKKPLVKSSLELWDTYSPLSWAEMAGYLYLPQLVIGWRWSGEKEEHVLERAHRSLAKS